MKYILLGIIVLFFISCEENRGKNQGGILNIPEDLISYDSKDSLNLDEWKSNSLIIYTSINTSCATCLLEIKNWREIEGILKKNKVLLVPICHSKDNFELLIYLFESGELERLNFQLFLDKKNEFINSNKNLLDKTNNITVLTNVNNKILLQGSPFDSQKLMDRYIEVITKTN
tara:strand:- start:7557 stop:8075 length:519 start_codon:yes stop_codon:yes gene_type:complete